MKYYHSQQGNQELNPKNLGLSGYESTRTYIRVNLYLSCCKQ